MECSSPVDPDTREVPLRPHCLARAVIIDNILLNKFVKRFNLKIYSSLLQKIHDNLIRRNVLTFNASWPVPSPSITAAGSKFKSDGMSAVVSLFMVVLVLPEVLWFPVDSCDAGGTLGGPPAGV